MKAIRQREDGQSFVELALVLPLLTLLFLGMVDLGLSYNTYLTLSNGAREGARWISTNPANLGGARQRIWDEVARGGLAKTEVTVSFTPTATGKTNTGASTYDPGDEVIVTVTHTRPLAFGLITGFPSVTLRATSTMQVIYAAG